MNKASATKRTNKINAAVLNAVKLATEQGRADIVSTLIAHKEDDLGELTDVLYVEEDNALKLWRVLEKETNEIGEALLAEASEDTAITLWRRLVSTRAKRELASEERARACRMIDAVREIERACGFIG